MQRTMRIAQIAPPWYTVPPHGYGGIELVASLLTEGLVARGHDVTLFASGGSLTKAELVSPLEQPPDPALLGNVWFEAMHALSAYDGIDQFDVVHDHSGIIGPAIGALLEQAPPVVHTLHGPWTGPARSYYSRLDQRVHLVAISEAQRNDNPGLRYAGTVHNGVDVAEFPFRAIKNDFLMYIGRANPDKGPARAIDIAKRAGMPLVMVVKKAEPLERSYWDEYVAPMVTDDVEVYESMPVEVKLDLLSRARALVFPIDWPEPFGLVMIEAMACGTPVIACPVGAATEIVVDGVTGFLRQSLADLIEAVERAPECDPIACRRRVEQHYSTDLMVTRYEQIYREVLRAAAEPTGFSARSATP
jgi:glycosyltransferase involved in cell wall biosynthesis